VELEVEVGTLVLVVVVLGIVDEMVVAIGTIPDHLN
jgi:hypothetical protein